MRWSTTGPTFRNSATGFLANFLSGFYRGFDPLPDDPIELPAVSDDVLEQVDVVASEPDGLGLAPDLRGPLVVGAV